MTYRLDFRTVTSLGTVLKPTEEELRHGVILGCKLLFSQVWISLAVQQYRLNHRVSAF